MLSEASALPHAHAPRARPPLPAGVASRASPRLRPWLGTWRFITLRRLEPRVPLPHLQHPLGTVRHQAPHER